MVFISLLMNDFQIYILHMEMSFQQYDYVVYPSETFVI